MKAFVWAALDIGTNSVKLLVARIDDDGLHRLHHALTITRMGESLAASGRLGEDAMRRTLEAIRARVAEARSYAPVGISLVGTEAFRRAANGPAFAAAVEREIGAPVRILEGREEAAMGRAAIAREFGGDTRFVVLDIGGGSTELALSQPTWEISVPIGAVVATERWLVEDPPDVGPMRRELGVRLRDEWSRAPRVPVVRLVGVGGTVTTYAAIALGLDAYDSGRVHRSVLTRETVGELTDRLAALPLARRREVRGLHPDRAPVILGGGGLLEAAMDAVGLDRLEVSETNLLHAFLLEESVGKVGTPTNFLGKPVTDPRSRRPGNW